MTETASRSRSKGPKGARATPDPGTRLAMYRTMVECRRFEVRAQELFFEGLVRGTTHLGVGQEAVAAGFAAAMREDDYSFATYRGHNHALARGASMARLYAELFGRASGLMGGKGGSMHITSAEHHMLGSYAIVGAHLPIALGAAWSAQYRESGQVAVCFFGDGTTNIGAFHEALNMAAVWNAPVVFVCENNQYMEYTAIGDVTAVKRPAADRAAAYGLEAIVVDGNDVGRRVRHGIADDRPSSGGRGSIARRGTDLSPRRAFASRPGQVPARTTRSSHGSLATPFRRTGHGSWRPGWPRRSSRRSKQRHRPRWQPPKRRLARPLSHRST